jgi:hypothetical protein
VTDLARRIVLRPEVTADDARFVPWKQRWRLAELQRQDAGTFTDTWTTSDGAAIHLVDDRPIGTLYFISASDEAAEHIRQGCAVWSFADAVAAISSVQDRDGTMLSIYAAALTAPDTYDEKLVTAFSTAAHDPDLAIRQAVVIATSYLPWSALVDLTRTIRDTDPDPDVRATAQTLLEGVELEDR